jgi:hypothetical protein
MCQIDLIRLLIFSTLANERVLMSNVLVAEFAGVV